MNDNQLRICFEHAIAEQKSARIQIVGRHNVIDSGSAEAKEVVDFNFQAESRGLVDLDMIEVTTSATSDQIHMLLARDGEDREQELVQQAIVKLESFESPRRTTCTFSNRITNQDGMALNLQTSAANIARYGGRVSFEHGDVARTASNSTTEKPASHSHWVHVSLVWRYRSWIKPRPPGQVRRLPAQPNIHPGPRPMTWNHRIQHAMVDGRHGLITLEDEFDSTVPMMKAIQKFALHERLTMQGQFGTSRIHKWGLDEPNEEPSYAGDNRFGRGMQSLPRSE